jgi:triacylglycerol esterase/lipase EstA (alpha/beta hydrolase family)
MTQEAPMRDTPVILVHGFMATSALMRPMRRQLRREGFQPYLANLSPFCIQDVRRLAAQLSETIERVCFVEDVEQVNVVGVSLGGATALYYQQAVAPSLRIRRLVAVGTPFLGSEAAQPVLPLLGRVSAGVWQTLPGSDFIADLIAAGIPEGMTMTSIAMEGDPISPPP